MFIQLKDIPYFEIIKGFHAKMIHTESLSIAHISIEAGHKIGLHQHPHEQVTNILEGQLEMTVDGTTKVCQPGDVITIPSNALHSAKAITDCRVIDIFQPVREDYKM